jgi:hypothetical protein
MTEHLTLEQVERSSTEIRGRLSDATAVGGESSPLVAATILSTRMPHGGVHLWTNGRGTIEGRDE